MEKEKIKVRLVNALKQIDYDLPTLATQLGISQKRLENYINGKTLPTMTIFANMCKILRLDADYIIRGD